MKSKKLTGMAMSLLGEIRPEVGGPAVLQQVTANTNSIASNTNSIATLGAQLAAVATLFAITFNSNNTINTEKYTTHTHSYTDDTIDSLGTTTSTNKVTGSVITN